MKRFFISTIALIVAVTACTESGLIDAPQFYNSEIVFDTYIGKAPVTKAENIDLTYLETSSVGGAHLYAFMCDKGNRNISNVDFSSAYLDGRLKCTTPTNYNTTPATAGVWEYQIEVQAEGGQSEWVTEEAYWPGETKDLAFVAYNLAADSCIDKENQDLTHFDFSIKPNIKDQIDLLATPLTFHSETGNQTTVSLKFHHLLSRVGFKVIPTTASSAVDINIYRLKLTGAFPESGYVNLSSSTSVPTIIPHLDATFAPEYSLFYGTETFTINSGTCVEVDNSTTPATSKIVAKPVYGSNSTETNRYMMIMPGSQSNAAIEVEYNLSGQGDTKSYARIPLSGENGTDWSFEPGKAYEFILKISTDAIEFSAEVSDEWTEHPTTATTKPLVPKPV